MTANGKAVNGYKQTLIKLLETPSTKARIEGRVTSIHPVAESQGLSLSHMQERVQGERHTFPAAPRQRSGGRNLLKPPRRALKPQD